VAKKDKEKKPVRKKVTAVRSAVKTAPRKKDKAPAPAPKAKKSAGILLHMPPAAKKVPAAKPKKVEPLTKQDLEHFRLLLLEKRAELLGDVNSIESEALKKSRLDAAGDLSSMPIHMADLGTDNFEQEFSLGLMASERKILSEINAALKRIDDGSFGICEGTGDPIPRARLEANPWARYTIEYASQMERGLTQESRPNSYGAGFEEDEESETEEHEEAEETAEEKEAEPDTEEELAGLFGVEEEEEEEKEEKEM
jgi:DnaK suppressor protein